MRAGRLGGYFMMPVHRDEVAAVRQALERGMLQMPSGLPRIQVCKVLDRFEQVVDSGAEERAAGGAWKSGA